MRQAFATAVVPVIAMAAAKTARADFVDVTLGAPNQTVTVPASGSTTLDFMGALSFVPDGS